MPNVLISLTQPQIDSLLALTNDLRAFLERHNQRPVARRPRRPDPNFAMDPWLECLETIEGERVASADIFIRYLGFTRKASSQDAHRVRTLMLHLGWKRALFRIGGKLVRGYERLAITKT